jgi:7-carboxy-7-deazaguanine synthase
VDNKILITEIFGRNGDWSLQGEGYFAGTPTIFIRTFGCNLRCSFGDPKNEETNLLRTKAGWITDLNNFPILKTGCDTSYSVYPEFLKFSKWYTPEQLYTEIEKSLVGATIKPHIAITGGEPMLPKWQKFWAEALPMIYDQFGISSFTFETNGTQFKTFEFQQMCGKANFDIHFSVSPKLSNSGHTSNETLFPERVREYTNWSRKSWFKYVVGNESDIHEILFFHKSYNIPQDLVPVFLMPQGGTRDEYLANEPMVYKLCSQYGFHFSPRLHVTGAGNGIGI